LVSLSPLFWSLSGSLLCATVSVIVAGLGIFDLAIFLVDIARSYVTIRTMEGAMKKAKTRKIKVRNLVAVDAKFRNSAGPMKNKAERGSGKGSGKYARHDKHKGKIGSRD